MQTFDENNFAPVDALIAIQCELKAPKGKRNNFGNFNYRSAEDILEAVKPLLGKHQCQLTLTDEIVCFGERLFVRSIATLIAPDGRADLLDYCRQDVALTLKMHDRFAGILF